MRSIRLAVKIRLDFSFAKTSAHALPIPEEAPVISVIFPFNRFILYNKIMEDDNGKIKNIRDEN
jgi:hypothetical protein